MGELFIIGLIKQTQSRVESAARRAGMHVYRIVADLGKERTLMLMPRPDQAIYALKSYIDRYGDNYEDVFVIALPYAPIPDVVRDELEVLEDCGGEVVWVQEGEDGWPKLECEIPDKAFLSSVSSRIIQEFTLVDECDELPSVSLRRISEENGRILIASDVYDVCDQVSAHRREFFRKAVSALNEIIQKNGQVGRIDKFFSDVGLDYAQTGGISTKLEVYRDGRCVYSEKSHIHLKQGDKTTPQAAARIYYHGFFLDDKYYIAILYAGPHPDADVTWTCDVDR